MNSSSFYNSLADEFEYIKNNVKVNDSLIDTLLEAFESGKYSIEEFIKRLKEFLEHLKRLNYTQEEQFHIVQSYIDYFNIIDYDQEALDELLDRENTADDQLPVDQTTEQPEPEQIEAPEVDVNTEDVPEKTTTPQDDFKQLVYKYAQNQNDSWLNYMKVDDAWLDYIWNAMGDSFDDSNVSVFIKKYLKPIGNFVKKALTEGGWTDYSKEELYDLVTEYIESYFTENPEATSIPTDNDAVNDYLDAHSQILDDMLGNTNEGEEPAVQIEPPFDPDSGITKGDVVKEGDFSYEGSLLYKITSDGVELDSQFVQQNFKTLSDLIYNSVGVGGDSIEVKNGTWVPTYILTGDNRNNFLNIYMYQIYLSYLKGKDSFGLTDPQDETLMNIVKQLYDSGTGIIGIINMEAYNDMLVEAVNALEKNGNDLATDTMFENINYLQHTIGSDYSLDQILDYAVNNQEDFNNQSATVESVNEYFNPTPETDQDKVDNALSNAVQGLKENKNTKDTSNYTQITQSDVDKGIDYDQNNYPDVNWSTNYRDTFNSVTSNGDGTYNYRYSVYYLKNKNPDWYQSMLDAGLIVENVSSGYFTGKSSYDMFESLLYVIYNEYIKNEDYLDIEETTQNGDKQVTIGLSDEDKVNLSELANYYRLEGSFTGIGDLPEYSDLMMSVFRLADINDNAGWIQFFQYYNFIEYYVAQVNPDYTIDDVIGVMQQEAPDIQDNITNYMTNTADITESINNYYATNGDNSRQLVDVNSIDYTSDEYQAFADSMDSLVKNIVNSTQLTDEDKDSFVKSLYSLYLTYGNNEGLNDFASRINDLSAQITEGVYKAYGYWFSEEDLNDFLVQYIKANGTSDDVDMSKIQQNDDGTVGLVPQSLANDAQVDSKDAIVPDFTSDDYQTFVSKMQQYDKKLGYLILDTDTVAKDSTMNDEMLQALYTAYLNRDVSQYKDYKQFAEGIGKITSAIEQSYTLNPDSEMTAEEVDQAIIDYLNNYGMDDFDVSRITRNDDGTLTVEQNTLRQLQEDNKNVTEGEGLFATTDAEGNIQYFYAVNDDGTWELYKVDASDIEKDDDATIIDANNVNDYGWADKLNTQIDSPNTSGISDDFLSEAEVQKWMSHDSSYTPLYIKNDDGTYDIYQQLDDGTYVRRYENYKGDLGGTAQPVTLDQMSTPDGTKDTTNTEKVAKPDSLADETNPAGDVHTSQMNENINIFQQTDNFGPINLKTKETLPDEFYQDMLDSSNAQTINEEVYMSENGINFVRLDGRYDTRLRRDEWDFIRDSFKYDTDITQKYEVAVGDKKIPTQFQTKFVNPLEYFYELGQTPEFYDWLDKRKKGDESRSYIYYMLERTKPLTSAQYEEYQKTGRLSQAIPGLDANLLMTNKTNTAQVEQAILETHQLGIDNVSTFVLASSMCHLFSAIIMANVKKIADNPVISNFEYTESKQFRGYDDAVITGMYEKGSKIRDAVENGGNINKYQADILKLIFQQRSFKTLAEYEVSNRYGEIVFNFFGKQADRNTQLKMQPGVVIFNIGLIILAYFAAYNNTFSTMGIDTDPTSNIIKIISKALEFLYPAKTYNSEILRQLQNTMSEFVSEVRSVRANFSNEGGTFKELLYEPVANMIHKAFYETNTDFNVDHFFTKDTMDHLTTNFGMEFYIKMKNTDTLINFLLDGIVDAQQFNQSVLKMMVTTLGKNFGFNANNMFDVLFMDTKQASVMLLNPKFNILIPLLHPEVIGIIPEQKAVVNVWGLGGKIIGFVEYDSDIPEYRQEINKEIDNDLENPDDEPYFFDEEDAILRAGTIGASGVEETDAGYRAGVSQEERETIYNNRHEPENQIIKNVTAAIDEDRDPQIDKQVTIMEEPDDFDPVSTSFEIQKNDVHDWNLAGIMEFVNEYYGLGETDYQDKLQGYVTNWKSEEVKMEMDTSPNRDFVVFKNENSNQLFVAFKGSQTFDDWMSNIWVGFATPRLRGYKNNNDEDYNKRDHAGFTSAYKKHSDKLRNIVKMMTNSKTKIYVSGHSRGTALANLFLEDIADLVDHKNVVYRGFAGVNFRREESAKKFAEKTEGMDLKTYVIEGDPIRYVNKFLPYYPTGETFLITSNTRDGEGMIFKQELYDKLNAIETDGAAGLKDLEKILKSEFAENHGIDMYKVLLAQDKHVGRYKGPKKDKWLGDSLLNKIVGSSLAIIAAGRIGQIVGANNLLNRIRN